MAACAGGAAGGALHEKSAKAMIPANASSRLRWGNFKEAMLLLSASTVTRVSSALWNSVRPWFGCAKNYWDGEGFIFVNLRAVPPGWIRAERGRQSPILTRRVVVRNKIPTSLRPGGTFHSAPFFGIRIMGGLQSNCVLAQATRQPRSASSLSLSRARQVGQIPWVAA